MTGFESGSSGIGSGRAVNCTTPPPKDLFCLCADVIGGCLKTNGNISTYLNILFSLAVIIYVNMIYTFALISNIFSASGKKIRPKYGKV